MNRIFNSFLIIVVFIALTTIVSCSKTCDSGYEGKRCDVPIRDKFEGIWNATDNPGNKVYLDTITDGVNILDVIISSSFSGDSFPHPFQGTIAGNTINIAKQKRYNGGLLFVSGSGTLSGDSKTINWNYDFIDGTVSPEVVTSYTGVWTK